MYVYNVEVKWQNSSFIEKKSPKSAFKSLVGVPVCWVSIPSYILTQLRKNFENYITHTLSLGG